MIAAIPDPAILPTWVLIIAAIGTPVVALIGILLTNIHLGSRLESTVAASQVAVSTKVDTLEIKINSKMDKLLELTEKAAFAAGILEGRERSRLDAQAGKDRPEAKEDDEPHLEA